MPVVTLQHNSLFCADTESDIIECIGLSGRDNKTMKISGDRGTIQLHCRNDKLFLETEFVIKHYDLATNSWGNQVMTSLPSSFDFFS